MGKKVLVIGSTGTMGRYLVPCLADMGYAVTGVSLDDEIPYNENVTCIKGDAMDKAFVESLVKEKYDGIVNFMCYDDGISFADWYKLFLDNTDHYIFLSSCRVYADEEWPIKETSPRLLEVSTDPELLASQDYCMEKARSEDLLWASDYQNFTIVRPATTFANRRFPLVTLEANVTIGRARRGKKVVLPIQAKDKPATLCWGGDVAKMIARLMFKQEAMREVYNVCSSESHTWGEIAEYYHELCGLEAVWVDKEDYLKIKDPAVRTSTRWQLEYARLFHRITDNSKMLAATGLKQSEFMTLYDTLKMMLDDLPEGCIFPDSPQSQRMDKYLEEHNL